jgi:ABC-2 type transport system permease protein
MRNFMNIFWLGTKELRSFLQDSVLIALVIYAFSLAAIAQARSNSQEVYNASIAMVDEDHSQLSRRITHAFLPPYFQAPSPIAERDILPLMNIGRYTFVVDVPPNFERDVLAGHQPALQVNVDATTMVQAGLGAGYIQQIITNEIADFPIACGRRAATASQPGRAHRVQSEHHYRMVHQRYGDHQQHYHAGDRARWRSDHPRA